MIGQVVNVRVPLHRLELPLRKPARWRTILQAEDLEGLSLKDLFVDLFIMPEVEERLLLTVKLSIVSFIFAHDVQWLTGMDQARSASPARLVGNESGKMTSTIF